jgi:FlaA1/EpsC-like NDP-sugar epimerase
MNNFIKNFLSKSVLPYFTILVIDLLMVVFSCFSIYLLRYGFGGLSTTDIREDGITLALLLVFFNTISFFIFRTFRGVLRFSSFVDLTQIVKALTLGYGTTYTIIFIIKGFNHNFNLIGITAIAIFFTNMFLMIFSRILVKEVYESIMEKNTKSKSIFVYGTKEAGISVAKALRGNKEYHWRVLGFISDESHMVGKEMMGVNVYANDEKIFSVLEKRAIKTIIVSPTKMENIKNSDLLDKFLYHGISLLTTTPVDEWTETLTVKEVQIEDLLPRPPIKINMQEIAENIEGKRVMITGAAGSIGSEIVRQVALFNPYNIILIDQAETPLHDIRLELQKKWRDLRTEIIVADVGNASRMEQIFGKTRPQYIFHAAAYKHVPMMEDNVSESVQTNILGTKTVADLAVKHNVHKFVMVSTDKAVNPSNVMGCSKRICEIYIQSLAKHIEKDGQKSTQFITTRFGNVLGSNGSVIPLFREQIKNGGPVTVTHPEIIRYFMTIPEACQLVLEAGSMGNGGEIYIFDMGKPVKIVDLAKRMIRLSGMPNIKIEFTGLRHGEKLYEELLNCAEQTKPTHHEKIMIANVREYEYIEVNNLIDSLIKISYDYNDMRTVKKMKEVVPEFQSKNSPFESIDRALEEAKEKREKLTLIN